MNLRPYQDAALEGIRAAWGEHRKVLAVMPTGTGKTILFAHLAKKVHEKGGRTLILAHRDELIRQAADKIMKATGLQCAVEKAGESGAGSFLPVVVGSVQTMRQQRRMDGFHPGEFRAIVVDEAHHCLSDSYQAVLSHFTGKTLGVTATPDRGDKKSLGQYFDALAYEYGMAQAIKDGWLCKIAAKGIPVKIDLASCRIECGDYRDDDIDAAIMPVLKEVAKAVATEARTRKTLLFLPLVRTSQAMSEMLRNEGIDARHIDGASPDRKQLLQWFATPGPKALTNSALLTEGYDQPDIDCVVCLRPTKVRALYQQIVGRGTRIHPGKENLLLLDFLWMTGKLDLCHPASLFAKSAEVAAKATDIIANGGGEKDVEDAINDAEKDVQSEREAKLARELKAQSVKKTVDPIAYALSIGDADLEDYEPAFAWEKQPASQKQIDTLGKFGFSEDKIQNKGFASMLLNRLFARRSEGLCTPKQAAFIRRKGFDPSMMTFEQAGELITTLIGKGRAA